MDANYGMLLEGQGNGKFRYIDQKTSGLKIMGDVRSVIQMEDQLIIGINEDSIKTFRIAKNTALNF